jgi:hypothetical protein
LSKIKFEETNSSAVGRGEHSGAVILRGDLTI